MGSYSIQVCKVEYSSCLQVRVIGSVFIYFTKYMPDQIVESVVLQQEHLGLALLGCDIPLKRRWDTTKPAAAWEKDD